MNEYQTSSREFVREYQKRALTVHILGMSWFQLLRVAYYCFEDSKVTLSYHVAQRIAGDQHKVDDFLKRFPMTDKTLLTISKAMMHETADPAPVLQKK